jgi:hypothetical protein
MELEQYVVQEDSRSSLNLKHAYVGTFSALTVLLIAFVSTRTLWGKSKCRLVAPHADLWNGINWFALSVAVIALVFCIYFIVYWRYAWLATRQKKKGEDVEDVDPYSLSRSGINIMLHSNKTYAHMLDQTTTATHRRFDE